MGKFNVCAEMDFLKQFQKCEEISNIEYKLKKICKMLGMIDDPRQIVDTSRNIFKSQLLAIPEYVWASKILKEHGCEVDVYEYLDDNFCSLHLGNYKLIYAKDLEGLEFLPYFHYSYNHLDDKFDEVTTILIGKDALETRESQIRLFNEIVTGLVADLVNSKYHIDLSEFCDSFGSRIEDNSRFMIDIYIVIYRLIDSIVDLKFTDAETILDIGDTTGEIDELRKLIFEFAIKTDTNEDDYCELIETLYDKYFLEGFTGGLIYGEEF